MKPSNDCIYVQHFPSVRSSELADLREALLTVSDSVVMREQQPSPQASLDWALPASVEILVPASFVASYLGSLAANVTTKVVSSLYGRIKGRSKWRRSARKTRLGPVISVTLANALPAQQAQMVFAFPPGMSRRQFSGALSRLPDLVRRERKRHRRFFEPPGTLRGYLDRSVRLYYQRSNHRWKRVWPDWTDWAEQYRM